MGKPVARSTKRAGSPLSVAVFGAGIFGTCTALELADRGHRVTVFERNSEPLSEASLYNEGKLHLGFVYAADRSFRTAQRMIDGAVRFMDIVGRWIPQTALRALPARPFDYLVHRDTMIGVSDVEAHFSRVAAALGERLLKRSSLRPWDVSRPAWRRLGAEELATRYDPDVIAAAYETCEIAVDTWALARELRGALRAHPRIELRTRTSVVTAEDRAGGGFQVVFDADARQRAGPFDAVVNALWANRPAIDERYGLPQRSRWFIRRKLGVNLRCSGAADVPPSFTIMLGPFGDVVSYRSGRVYLSWYPACMIGTTTGAEETDWNAVMRAVDFDTVKRETMDALARICPALGKLEAVNGNVVINGGSIFALGESDIVDPASRLHERLDMGVHGRGRYLSVDPAKFTLAPATAIETADRVAALP